ncbi:hypothetical protein SAMN05192545_3947 [Maribacter dokdonensis]|uniref:HTH cro/C1-type domain-containing protein n=1 Tax=Maribacter dokdonensis TaxID=320912 RepID=A0ABY0V0E9_9FLAO|nr:helix-turn-helix transcriptional regulator [Maribacter dokdonensis]SDT46475.1 hypothetical protein SAMN05192545_3895 [Maribacter dokdonensis]SDT47743.1 hypothetical protein SAMN05192545_3947 [Maribacter dokdonensis]
MIYDKKTLERIISYLQLRFPVAELSSELNYSKSAVSNYLNGNKPISAAFVESLEKHYKIKFEDFVTGSPAKRFPALKMDNTKEISIFIAENANELMKDPLFKTVIESLFLRSEIQSLKNDN